MTSGVVTVTGPSVTAPPAGLLRAVAERYGLGELSLGERLTGGYANVLYRLETTSGPFALRLELTPEPEGIEWEHRVVASLGERLPEIPAPVHAIDGTTWFRHGDVAVWLLPLVDGVPADRANELHRLEAARLLGRLHAAGRELAVAPRPDVPPLRALAWPEGPVEGRLRAYARLMREARAWAIDFVRGLRSRPLVTGIIHGDVFRGNVLFAGDRAVGLVDWEEATVDWQAYELANGVWEFCKLEDDNGFDRAAGERFAAACRDAGGTVPASEDDLLISFIRVRRIVEVLRARTDRHVDWDYQRDNLRAFVHLA